MLRLLPLLLLMAACSGKGADSGTDGPPPDFREKGPHHTTFNWKTVNDFPVLVWSPTALGDGEYRLSTVTSSDARATILDELVRAAPEDCPEDSYVGRDKAEPLSGTWPLVAMSHCHECTANSLATIAQHLASWGYVVVAPSHEGNTLYDALDGTGMGLDTDTLAMRVDQLDAAIEAAQNGDLGVNVNDELSLVGHSFGAVTVGMRAQRDPVPTVFLAAPADNPLLPGVDAANLTGETTWVLLEEDNSISEVGNTLIESNFAEASGPSRLARLPNAGHWSVSDIVGLTEATMPGCGDDTRQDGSGEIFTYLPPSRVRQYTAGLVTVALADGVEKLDALDGWEWFTVEAQP